MKLHITRSAWDKIMMFTQLTPGEISGLGKVTVTDKDILVTDVAIFRQTVSAAHSTIPTKALAEFQTERVQAGESMKQWCFWWHSHAEMGVFFSGTDTNTIEGSTEFPYLVSLVVNKKREHKARLDVHYPVHMYMDLTVEIIEEDNESIKEICQAEIDAKVTIPKTEYKTYMQAKDYLKEWGFRGPVDQNRDIQKTVPFDSEDWDVAKEWDDHKMYLIAAIKKAKRENRGKLMESLKDELREHMIWGKSNGITSSPSTTKDRSDYSILKDIPTRE